MVITMKYVTSIPPAVVGDRVPQFIVIPVTQTKQCPQSESLMYYSLGNLTNNTDFLDCQNMKQRL